MSLDQDYIKVAKWVKANPAPFQQLIANTLKAFPLYIDEIRGMANGTASTALFDSIFG